MGFYSLSVWRGINEYFRKELSSYITSEFKNPQVRRPYSPDEAKIDSMETIDSRPKYMHASNPCVTSISVTTNAINTECIGVNPILPKEQSSSNNNEAMREHSCAAANIKYRGDIKTYLIGNDEVSKHYVETSDQNPIS